jgi:predicted dehydrogenase
MESWKRKLRMGMVGGGQGAFIGAVHRTAAALGQQIELVAGCFSRDPENTRRTGQELYLDPGRCYATFEEMAAREAARPAGDRIDFVTIVTPNRSHFPAARAFLERGIHVMCDKPMTFDVAEARELTALVERTGLVFGVSHNYTGSPLVRHARELFRDGAMGRVRKVIVEYLQDFLVYPHEKHGQKQALWRVDPAQAGLGGTLGDCGSHALNLLEYVIGPEVAAVCADKSTFLSGRQLDEDVNFLLRLRSGGKGVMTVSQIATGEENALTLRIYAEEGAIKWAQENPNYLEVYRYGEERRTLTRGSGYLSGAAASATRVPTGHPEGYLEAFATIYDAFVRAVRAHLDGGPLPPSEYGFPDVHAGLRGMEFIHAAVQSAGANAQWVNLPAP